MALTKHIILEKNFVGEFQHCELNTITIIKEDGIELSRSSHRGVCMCGDDDKALALGIKPLTDIVWTQPIRDSYMAFIEIQNKSVKNL